MPRSGRCVGSDQAIGGHFILNCAPIFCGRGKHPTLVGLRSPFAECPTIYVRKNLVHPLPARKPTETATKEELRERNMVDFERSTPPTRIQHITKHKLLQLGVTTALATGLLVVASGAQARITKIEISNRATAFGGYSFPGVGQYEVITGVATGEVNPNSLQNSVITDIKLAPTNANSNVVYQHNFYILKPLNLKQGNHKMMYEPPNRGGKTYQTLNNTPTDFNKLSANK